MEENELRMVLDSHMRWLDGKIGGEKASLGGADLGGMKLVGLNLTGVACCDVEPADWLAVWEKVKSSTYKKSVEGGE